MYPILGVETGVVYEVDATPDNVARRECGAVRLAAIVGRVEECVSVVSVVTIGMSVPPCNVW